MQTTPPPRAQDARPNDWSFWQTVALLAAIIIALWVRDAAAQSWENIGPRLHGGGVLLQPHEPGVLFMKDGPYWQRSADSGQSWSEIEGPEFAMIQQLSLHPTDPDIVYGHGTSFTWGSDFISGDGGQSFDIFDTGLLEVFGGADLIYPFVINPGDPDEWLGYNEMANPSQLTLSTDGGATWSEPWAFDHDEEPQFWTLEATGFTFDPHTPGRIIAVVGRDIMPGWGHGLMESLDSGQSWQVLADEGPNVGLEPHPDMPGVWIGRQSGFYATGYANNALVSTDGGATWSTPPEPVTGHSVLQLHPDGIYAACAEGVFLSEDGVSWQPVLPDNAHWPARFANFKNQPPSFTVAPWNADLFFLFGNGTLLSRSADGGVSWAPAGLATPGYSSPRYSDAVLTHDPDHLFARNPGGVRVTHDGGGSWRPLLYTAHPQFAVHPLEPGRMALTASDFDDMAGAFDVPLHVSSDGGVSWMDLSATGGEWQPFMQLAFEPVVGGRMVALTWDGMEGMKAVIYDADGAVLGDVTEVGYPLGSPVFDPQRPDTVYLPTNAGTYRLSLDQGELLGPPMDLETDYLAFDPAPGSDRAIARRTVGVAIWGWYLSDHGETVENDIAFPPSDLTREDAVVFTPAGDLLAAGEDGLYESVDHGLSWARLPGDYGLVAENGRAVVGGDGRVVFPAAGGGLRCGEDVLGVDEGPGGENDPARPAAFGLSPAYPNPFNPTARVELILPATGEVLVELVNLTGRTVATVQRGVLPAGRHTVTVDGSTLASGTYLLRAVTGDDRAAVQRVTLVK